jgi:hypothetical protein
MNMKAINLTGVDNAYADIITRYFEQRFPGAFKAGKQELLEILTSLLVGTKEIRYGANPRPESLVKIRATILTAIEKDLPIPILVPWGGTKSVLTQRVDVAEVAALWQLITVDEVLRRYYEPGLLIHIGIEDSGAYWLYRDVANAVPLINTYSEDFFNLTRIVRGKSNIKPVRESTLMKMGDYCDLSGKYSDLVYDYLVASQAFPSTVNSGKEFDALKAIGWVGSIPFEQRSFYTDRYKAANASISDQEATRKLSDYLGGAKARYDLGAKADPKTEVGSYIKISFTPPVPGAPSAIFSNTLYYRTVPLSDARTHIAPWRAKGYLEITDGSDKVKTKITSWNDDTIGERLIQSTVSLTDNDNTFTVQVEADHLIKDSALLWAYMGAPMM